MRFFLLLMSVLILHMTSLSALAGSEAPQYAVGIGFDASTGTFGTDSTSTYAAVPFIVDWSPTERIDLELTVPLVYQRTKNTGLAATGGTVKSTARRIMGGGLYSYTGASTALASGVVADESVSGLGDITLTGGYALVQDSETTPYIRPTFYVKFPTADDTKGLSTGKFDVGPGLAVSKWLGNWQPFAEGRYIFQGASYDETGALNFLTADAGVGYSWSESLITSVYGRSGSRLFDGMEAPLEARLKVVWRFGARTYTEAYALKGFSDGSPDYGGGVSLFKEF